MLCYVQRGGGNAVGCERLRVVEARDAELAQLMQDEERLKRRRTRQRTSHHHARQVSDVGPQPHNDGMVMMALNCA